MKALIGRALDAEGIRLLHLEMVGSGQGRSVRLFIDTPSGVGLDDCERASKLAHPIIEKSLGAKRAFNLEVSSPGIDRLLFSLEDMQEFSGNEASMSLKVPMNGSKQLRGLLKGTEGTEVIVETEKGSLSVPFENIKRANLVAKIDP